MRTSETLEKIAPAIVAAQAEMPAVKKSATNPHFKSKYAPLDAIVKATSPVLKAHGLAVIQGGGGHSSDGYVTITTRILHESGEWVESDLTMRPHKDDPQGIGACVTYGSRYGYRMIGVVTDDDDDGNSAAPPKTTPAKPDAKGIKFRQSMGALKKKVGEQAYRDTLNAFGFEKCSEVPTAQMAKIYKAVEAVGKANAEMNQEDK